MTDLAAKISRTFGLGSPRVVEAVPGGLSNDLWRLETNTGTFAVKIMRVNATSAGFSDNIEAAHVIEANAFEQGVRCPEPIPLDDGRCLAEVDGTLARAHRWCDGQAPRPSDWLDQAGGLLAQIHSVGGSFHQPLDDEPWEADGWASLADHADMPGDLASRLRQAAPDLAALEAMTAAPGLMTEHAMSHGDLDPKNTLVVEDTLMALDWDAARAQPVVREAVSVALDWTTDVEGFQRVLAAYCRAGGAQLADEMWPFGGWVSSLGGWLVYNATARIDTALGKEQVSHACDRLLALHSSMDAYRKALS